MGRPFRYYVVLFSWWLTAAAAAAHGTASSSFLVLKSSAFRKPTGMPHVQTKFDSDEDKTVLTATTTPTTLTQSTIMSIRGGGADTGPITDLDNALIIGLIWIMMGCLPYVLGLIVPKVVLPAFFIPIYKNETKVDVEAARNAEILWKLWYCTLGLVLQIFIFIEAAFQRSSIQLLKDSYLLWATFYTVALLKIRHEAVNLKILAQDRTGIQIWHLIMVISLWLSALEVQQWVSFFNKVFGWLPLTKVVYWLLRIENPETAASTGDGA